MFKVMSFVDLGLYLKSFHSLGRYIRHLEKQLTGIVKYPNHKFMKQSIST